jgi:hypothetical protein
VNENAALVFQDVLEPIAEPAVCPEQVRLFVHGRTPVFFSNIVELAHVQIRNVPLNEPPGEVANERVLRVVALLPSAAVQPLDPPGVVPVIRESGLQVRNLCGEIMEPLEAGPSVKDETVALVRDDGGEVVCADVHRCHHPIYLATGGDQCA